MQVNNEFKPKIVAFCCNWCSYAGADLAGTNRAELSGRCKDHSSTMFLPCQSDFHSAGISAWCRWCHPLRMPSGRLPLYHGELLRTSENDHALLDVELPRN